MNTIEILNKMKDALMEHGWGKSVLQNPGGRLCLLGARNKVMGYSMDSINCQESYKADHISDRIESVLPKECRRSQTTGDTYTRAWIYNDRYAKSFNDVLDVLDQAILKEKEAQS